MMSLNDQPLYRRHSFLKRNPALSRDQFSHHYEGHHGPLAAGLAGFRKYTTRYIQNHVQDLPSGEEPLFDGVTMTTQVKRDDYSRGFFNEPDYEKVKSDEMYLFDLSRTISVLGQEESNQPEQATPYKALILAEAETFGSTVLPKLSKLVLNHLDRSSASALGFGSGNFEYDLLVEAWFDNAESRDKAFAIFPRSASGVVPTPFLPVREVLIFGPGKPWAVS